MQEALKANGQEALGWHIAKRRKTIKKMAEGWQKSLAQAYETAKARVRARVEHPFHVIKNIFKYKKARFKGLAKNDSQLKALFALSNLYMARADLRP
jgi:transposase, IS5 family